MNTSLENTNLSLENAANNINSNIKTFNRYETKFIVSRKDMASLLGILSSRMKPDGNNAGGKYYTINNIYCDTDRDDVIRRSLDHPYYKEKLRIRSYGQPAMLEDNVYLELKKKIGGVVIKRRAKVKLFEAYAFICDGIKPVTENYLDAQVLNEIEIYLKRNPVKPKVFIAYDRLALVDKADPDLRVTFDTNLRSRRISVNLECGSTGFPVIDKDDCVMEIKHSGAIPVWLTRVLSCYKIYKGNFSKYGTEYTMFLKNETTSGISLNLAASVQRLSSALN